ncbi:sulfite exporter TauE/SafE family protein [uncultured Jannaschia sp.]|uniref:sulfite exporter TauE/SafE family protein n=1 Tax=uncultured Jannaschia sp. TaxID=293347 RepID=UPI00260D0DB3|nr:sulfite exporter TauE/SafE family protein [uncultured Jannaschia sp.]
MPDALGSALAEPGLVWLLIATIVAGLCFGFAGFGTALIFLPIAASVVPPEAAVAIMSLIGMGSVVTMLPRTWAQSERRATTWMILAAVATMPAGIWLLARADPVPLRWAMCLIVAGTLAAVLSGWKLRLGSGPAPRLSLGAAAGLVGGATGLLGPVVILTTLASGDGAGRMRANVSTFLTVVNCAFLPLLRLQDALPARAVGVGLVLLPVYMLATLAGAALFRPEAERLYRTLAHLVVAAAVVAGLPLFD